MLNYKERIIPVLIALVFVLSCGEKIPIKEMSLAKLEISRAISVGAKKYAPQEIEEAEKKLIESHDFVKQDALDKSKDSAVASRKKAVEAYDKSIPLLAKDTLDIAKESLEKAEEANAEALAENEYKLAKDSFSEASGLFEQKDFYPSYEKSIEADNLAKEARNVAIGKKDILGKSIDEVKATLAEAETYNASTYAKDNVQTAQDNLIIAEESLGNLQLKKGFEAVEIAGSNADEAYLLAIKETAGEKINGAERLYSEAQNSEGAENAKDELNGAKEALDQSKSSFQDAEYKDAILSSEESARLSNLVLNSMKESANEKIRGAELIFNQAKASAGAAIATDQLKGAKDALDQSKSFFTESRYKESIASASECERLSNIVINTRKKGEGVSAPASAVSEEYFIYKVRFIPERRDCLWRIAEKYYSNPLFWKKIYQANSDKIYNPDLIWPNMLLKIPKLKESSAEKEKVTTPEEQKEMSAPVPEKVNEAAPAPEIEGEAMPAPEAEEEAVPAPEPEAGMEAAPVPEIEREAVPAPGIGEEAIPAPEAGNEAAPEPEIEKEAIPASEFEGEIAPAPEAGEEEVIPAPAPAPEIE